MLIMTAKAWLLMLAIFYTSCCNFAQSFRLPLSTSKFKANKIKLDMVGPKCFTLLYHYDGGSFPNQFVERQLHNPVSLEVARERIAQLKASLIKKGEASDLFGKEMGDTLSGILLSILQYFGGSPLYPSAESQAANLFYFLVKDHPFYDGNKRIGALLFDLTLEQNGIHLNKKGKPKMTDGIVAVLALLIAESNPNSKDTLVQLIMSLLE